jgi:hypothetical protein
MSNMRVVFDNAASRATLTASSTAGALAASNLQGDDKSNVWRAVGTVASLALSWPTAEDVGCFVAPVCNFSPTCTWRVRVTNEIQTTNLYRYSEQFDNALWTKNAVTCSGGAVNFATAPDGTQTADKIVETATTTSHYIEQSIAGFLAGQQVAFSFFVKAAGRSVVNILFDSASIAAPASSGAYFDLTTGQIRNITNGAAWAYSIDAFPDGWWRIKAVGTTTADGVLRARVRAVQSGTTVNYLGDVNYGFLLWGAQCELNAVTSYFPSVATVGVRPLGNIDAWQSYDYDSGTVLACPAPAIKLRGWTAAQAASAYAYGGGACARHWFPQMKAVGMRVDISDPDNLQGYLEAACLVAGPVWSPQYNASEASLTLVDTTEIYRTAAGSQGADAGFIYRRLPIDLSLMPPADRAAFVNIVRNSRAYPILVSVFPDWADLALERDNTVYGRRTKDSDVAIQYAQAYSTTIEIEEI